MLAAPKRCCNRCLTHLHAHLFRCVRKALPLADFIEINESCPNVHHQGGGGESHRSPPRKYGLPSGVTARIASGLRAGGAAAAEELRSRLAGVVAARDAAAAAGGRRAPVLVKLGGLGDSPAETVQFMAVRTDSPFLCRRMSPHAVACRLFRIMLLLPSLPYHAASPLSHFFRPLHRPPPRPLSPWHLQAVGVDGIVALNTQKDYAAFELTAVRAPPTPGNPQLNLSACCTRAGPKPDLESPGGSGGQGAAGALHGGVRRRVTALPLPSRVITSAAFASKTVPLLL